MQPFIDLTVETNSETIVKAVLVFAEGIFNGECHVVHPKEAELASKISVPLRPPKNVAVDLHIKVNVYM